MAITTEHQLTVGEFENLLAQPENSNRLLELVHGEVQEKMPTEEHGLITSNLVFALRGYVQEHKSGRVGVEVRHRAPSDEHNSRLPDVSYSTERRSLVTEGSVTTLPDLAIEIQSPTDTIRAMREKAAYYLSHGSRQVWLIYPRKRLVEVYYADGEIDIFRDGETITGEDVLPDFSLPVTEIFADPFAD